MTADTFDIQQLINKSGIPRRTIYFYVQQGLLPPPQGAGLAAYYTEDHLLRLQLIPVLRQEGLRLDEIRERFQQMSLEEMRARLQAAEQSQKAAIQKRAVAQKSIHEELNSSEGALYMPGPVPMRDAPFIPAGWGEQRFIHYSLPAGLTLSAPENLGSLDRQRLQQLLQAARQIFSGGSSPYVSHQTNPAGENSDPSGDGESQSA